MKKYSSPEMVEYQYIPSAIIAVSIIDDEFADPDIPIQVRDYNTFTDDWNCDDY